MRILIIHQVFVSPKEAGGTRHFELARYLRNKGHQVTIVASDVSYLTGRKILHHKGLVGEEKIEGIRILRAYTPSVIHKNFVWRVFAFITFMFTSVWAALQAGRVDVVMGTSPPLFQGVSAWVVSLLRRRPFLFEIRDLWPEFAIDMGVLTNPLLIRASRWLESFLYSRATHLLVNSPAYRDYLLKRGIPEPKISFIPNGVDTSMFDPEADGVSIRREFGLDDKFVITYAGALGPANDIDTVLRAARRLKESRGIHFLAVGDGKERPRLENIAHKWNLENVIFIGAKPKSEMPDFLAASNACLAILRDIPMFRTTYPNKVFDYMAAGRPTILAIDGVIREVVESANGGIFVEPGNAEALAEAVRNLFENPEHAREMGLNARRYVEKYFDRMDQAIAFENLLYKLCEN